VEYNLDALKYAFAFIFPSPTFSHIQPHLKFLLEII
jgi:hypothetical protein